MKHEINFEINNVTMGLENKRRNKQCKTGQISYCWGQMIWNEMEMWDTKSIINLNDDEHIYE